MSDLLDFDPGDLWYIKLDGYGSKFPPSEWGGYSQSFVESDDVYGHNEVVRSEHDFWGICGSKDFDHGTLTTLVFDLDVHKAPEDFDRDRVSVPEDTLLVKSQNGGLHLYFKVHAQRGELAESDFKMTADPGWDIDIRGSAVSMHVVAPGEIPGVNSPYEVVNNEKIKAVTDPADAAERVQLDGEPLLEYDPESRAYGGTEIDRDTEPPDEMPLCYHRALQVRAQAPDDHSNTHKVNVLAALCGLAAGYTVDDMVAHFCEEWPPGDEADREKTRYHLQHIADHVDRGEYSPPALSTLRDWGILEEGETCNCGIPYHGADDRSDLPETAAATDGGGVVAEQSASGGEPEIAPPTWKEVISQYDEAENSDERDRARYNASEVLLEQHSWRNLRENDELYWYDSAEGIFKRNGEANLREIVRNRLGSVFRASEVNELTEHIRAAQTVPEDEMGGPPEKIAVGNGVLDLSNGDHELLDHSPEYNFLARSAAEFDPSADCPTWRKCLDTWVPSETDKKKLQEYAGYTLMHWRLKWHKALFIVGPQGSGKSTFADTIRALHGEQHVASLSPQELTSRFGGAELHGKWANIRNDIPAKSVEKTGTFKEIVAGDPIKAERKGKDPFHFKPKAKHIFVANQLPDTENDDAAFYRRILLVAFPNTIPRDERDGDLDEKLNDELDGILNWALEGLRRLRSQGGFTGDLTPSLTAEQWDKWGHTVDRFAKACLDIGDAANVDSVPKKEIYQLYQSFCEQESMPCEMQQAMTRRLKTEHGATDGEVHVKGEQRRCFLNVELTAKGEAYLDDDSDGSSSAGLSSFD